jgi:hypothetical protein
MPKPRSKGSKSQESFLSTPHVKVEPVEKAPEEVLTSLLEKLQSREKLLILKSEELSSGNIPSVYSGEVEVIVIDARNYYKASERSRDILVVVRPITEKALVYFNYKMYVFLSGKWEVME